MSETSCVVTRTGTFDAPADRLWELVADFGGLDKVMDGIESCSMEGEGEGAVRTIPMGRSAVIERLDVFDPESRTLTYSILEGPLPFKDYSATMTVADSGDGASTLTWTGTFDPADGTAAADAEAVAGGIYDSGIAGFARALAG